uniref:Uncharacterized protein n=1 Tax=Plectus sambesii TaxID=2011161 RepID=A0A914VZV9_9BILA
MQEVAFTALSLLFLFACTTHMVSAQEEFIELTDMEKRSLMGQSNPSEYFMNAVRSAASPHQSALEDWLAYCWVRLLKKIIVGMERSSTFVKKYFWQGQTLSESNRNEQEKIPLNASFDEIFIIKHRRLIGRSILFVTTQNTSDSNMSLTRKRADWSVLTLAERNLHARDGTDQ